MFRCYSACAEVGSDDEGGAVWVKLSKSKDLLQERRVYRFLNIALGYAGAALGC